MFMLAWRPRTRVLMVGLLVIVLAVAMVVVGGRPSAQAFDCMSREPKPVSCPFLRIDQQGTPYTVEAWLKDSSGKELQHWKESKPHFTLLHWRWQGDGARIRGYISVPSSGADVPKTFFFLASETHCYLVNRSGVFDVPTDQRQPGSCNDNEDRPDQ